MVGLCYSLHILDLKFRQVAQIRYFGKTPIAELNGHGDGKSLEFLMMDANNEA